MILGAGGLHRRAFWASIAARAPARPRKDADIALFDGDPFEYTTHAVGTVVSGRRFTARPR